MRFDLPLKTCKRKSFQDEIAVLHNVHYTIMDWFPGSSNICSIDHAQNILNPDRGGNFRAFNLKRFLQKMI